MRIWLKIFHLISETDIAQPSKQPDEKSPGTDIIGIIIGSLVALITILVAIVIFIIFKHKRQKNNNNRCSLKTPVSDNTVSMNLSDLRSSSNGKVLNGHLYSGVALEDIDSDREVFHGEL